MLQSVDTKLQVSTSHRWAVGVLFLPMNIEHRVTMCGIERSLIQSNLHMHTKTFSSTNLQYPCTHTQILNHPSNIHNCHTLVIIETSVPVFWEKLPLFTSFAAIMHDKHIWISENMREHTQFKLLSWIRGCTVSLCTSCECCVSEWT